MTEDAKTTEQGSKAGPGDEPKLRLANTTPAAETPRPLERPPDLKVGRRGYDVAATDAFLARLEKSFHELTTERDALKEHVGELEQELVQHREQHDAVADALITAQTLAREVRARAEAEVESDRAEAAAAKTIAESEAAQIKAKAEEEAAAIVANAQVESAKLVGQMQEDVRAKQHEAETILDDAKSKVESLVHELLDRLPAEQTQTES
jgi:cell division septum initiation protein DivIVA